MADLTVQVSTDKGISPVFNAADAAGDTFTNTGKILLQVKNEGTVDCNLTGVAQRKCNFGELHNEVVTITAGATEFVGPFSTLQFNDNNGKVNLTYDQVDSVSVAVISLF